MLYGGGIFGLAIVVLWVWAVLDVISTDESMCRNLPKTMWLMVVIFLSGLGALAWLLLGRPENVSLLPGSSAPRSSRSRSRGLEDTSGWDTPQDEGERRARYAELDAELDRRLEAKRSEEQRLAEWERQLSEREAELRRREQGRDADS